MKFLLDEMFPADAASILRQHTHDAVHVNDIGLRGADDVVVAAVAREEQRALVTENVIDFASEPDLILVCVLKRNLAAGGAQASALAAVLHRWAGANRRPYLGQHWPK